MSHKSRVPHKVPIISDDCPECGWRLEWVADMNRWYCGGCSKAWEEAGKGYIREVPWT